MAGVAIGRAQHDPTGEPPERRGEAGPSASASRSHASSVLVGGGRERAGGTSAVLRSRPRGGLEGGGQHRRSSQLRQRTACQVLVVPRATRLAVVLTAVPPSAPCRARLIRLLTVPLGMPSRAAASRVDRPVQDERLHDGEQSRATAARSADPTSLCSIPSSTASSADALERARGAAVLKQPLQHRLARLQPLQQRADSAMPHSQAATSPLTLVLPRACPRPPGRCR